MAINYLRSFFLSQATTATTVMPPNGHWICGKCGWGNKGENHVCSNDDCKTARIVWKEEKEEHV